MISSKRIGFFWGEEKITVVECDKNTPLQAVSSPLGSKASTQSPFSSNLTEEIQITAILQKLLQDNRITGTSFYVSLPLKEIVLRSFVIPFVKQNDVQSAIKFEAKKYMPFDIQDLSFVFHTIPFVEGNNKQLQVIFFAVRKEVLARYDRVFKQVNVEISYCEPYMVSLTKALLFKKEIKTTDHLAFLILDKNLGRICFIDQGIPQFIREFPIAPRIQLGETDDSTDSTEALNLKIVNEVGNSFDFYARQFNGERIDQMLILSEFVQKDLFNTLERELKVKLTKFLPGATTGLVGSNSDMDAVYAMGACVGLPMEALSEFNFLGDNSRKSKLKKNLITALMSYKEVIIVFLMCALTLAGASVFFQVQLKAAQAQYNQLSAQEGAFLNTPISSIQAETQQNIDKLAQFKSIRSRSDLTFIILRVASHLPQGALLNNLILGYDESDANHVHVGITMNGMVIKGDPNEQIATINQVFSDFKNDKELSRFITRVNLGSLIREDTDRGQATGFNIHCS